MQNSTLELPTGIFFTLHKSAVFKGFLHCFTAIKAGSSAHCSPQRLPGVSAEGMSGTER